MIQEGNFPGHFKVLKLTRSQFNHLIKNCSNSSENSIFISITRICEQGIKD